MTLLDRADGKGSGQEGGTTPIHSAAAEGKPLTVVSPRIPTRQRLVNIWHYRELLVGMTRKELRVQYKDSVLGFVWSLLNPFVTLLVYFVVFQIILKNGLPRFAIYLTAGVLVWNFFSAALPSACGSVVSNAGIIKKVSFPREIPALANMGSALVQSSFQVIVLLIFLVAFRRGPAMEFLPVIPVAIIALLLFTASLGILCAAVNVKYRDLQHLLMVALNVWFWATPIVYPYRQVRDQIVAHHPSIHLLFDLYRCNPITPIVLTFQRAIYSVTSPTNTNSTPGHPVPINILPDHAGPWWYLWQDLLVIGFSLLLFAVAFRAFSRAEGNFAEEL